MAQTEQDLLSKIGVEACDALNKTDFGKRDTPDEIKVKLGLALLPALQNHREEIKKVMGLDISNSGDVRAIGEKVGAQLVYSCPKFQTITMSLLKKDEDFRNEINAAMNEDEIPPPPPPAADELVRGSIVKIEGTDLNAVYVQTGNDETVKIYWFEKPEGSQFLESWDGKDKTSTYTFGYRMMEIYQPKTKSYQLVKMLSSVKSNS
jgi:hypothetical protein